MSYGPLQVGELIIGNTVATQTTAQTFIALAADKSVKILSADGTAPAAKKPFKVLQKTGGDAGKGLNYEFSDIVEPNSIERITISSYAPEVQKSVTVSGFTGNVLPNTTYVTDVRIYNDGGTLSPENFATVQGFYSTGANIGTITPTTIRDGLLKSLKSNLVKRGDYEVVLLPIASPVGFSVTGKVQKVSPGKIEGRQIEFEVIAKVYDNVYSLTTLSQNLGLLTAVTTVASNPGKGTGKLAVNYEWFVKGYKYEVYRQTGYPVDFNTPYYADINGTYDVVDITYFKANKETTIEQQYKTLRTMIASGNLTTFIADLNTITGLTLVNPGTNLIN
jgi:hypothetical protein